MSDWTSSYFDDGYMERWTLSGPTADTAREVHYLSERLGVRRGSRVLDIGCGHGKFAIAFAQLGARVAGADSSQPLLNRARQIASELSVDVGWVRGDMRSLPFASRRFAAAIIIDSFGFFDADRANESVLVEIARILTPDGRVAMKVVNGRPVVAKFRTTDREEHDGVVVNLARTISPEKQMIENVTIDGPSGRREFQRRQRLYEPQELFAALERAGLRVINVSASLSSDTPFDDAVSPTIVVVAQREG